MYYSIRGTIVHKDFGSAALECGGVAYRCAISLHTAERIGRLGEEAKLFTYLSVREDALDLFGFYDENELSSFKMLLSVTGVGPKVALAVLSDLTPEHFAIAVATADYKMLTRAQGVGPKLAQRIVLELKDKIKGIEVHVGLELSADHPRSGTSEAIDALVVLGYSKSEASNTIRKLPEGLSIEEMIKRSLVQLSGQVTNK